MSYASQIQTATPDKAETLSKSSVNLIKFMEVFEQFSRDVEIDINKGV